MKIADMSLFDECFTHIDNETGKQTTYDATALFKFCEANPDKVQLTTVPIEMAHVAFCISNRGVEQDRLEVLYANPQYLDKPIVFIVSDDDSHLLVDGTHRYVTAKMLERDEIACYKVPEAVGAAFIIEDVPQMSEEAVMAPSQLTLLRKLGLFQ